MERIGTITGHGACKRRYLDNALVYDDEKCLSIPRFEDELVRHKALDVVGIYSC